ncbi:IPT/TIG domain-containing protein [Flagellimonas olearia]|uniref:IPT/TIG domain-containing protein n=1 Tax=Flagellimonas olearia TaxID=552546 RepID=A0A444VKK0_9FLAO|nr:IPT/TIG domain-containing protein [Allomuricauda olearia]RYC51264.1 hypothetical protein DN53_13735 [Allomuricauda olearia]
MKKAILASIFILALLLYISCDKDDDPTPDPEPQEVEITSFSPTSGTVGTEVTINGKNFSSAKEENNVTFGSFKAPVVEASPIKLVVQVPTNAVTGKITITVGSSSATSATNFEVLETAEPVSITGFAPKNGDFETIVTIDGSNFSETLAENIVKFGEIQAEVTGATTSKLNVKVPNGANTTLISVTVGENTAETQEYFKLPIWRKLDDFPGTARRSAFSSVVDGIAYVGMGIGDGNLYDIRSYDYITNTWQEVAPYPGEGNIAPAEFVVDGTTYVLDGLLGGEGLWSNEFRSYDVETNEWTDLQDFPGLVRYRATSFTYQERGYVVGGLTDTNTSLADVWEYNNNDGTWIEKQSYPQPDGIYDATSFVIDGQAYMGTGGLGTGSESSSHFYKFDGTNWTAIANLPQSAYSRSGAVGFAINGKGYVGLGRNHENYLYLQDFYEYDPVANSWTRLDDFPSHGRSSATAFVLDGKAYVGLGDAGGDLDEQQDIYLFDPANIAPE